MNPGPQRPDDTAQPLRSDAERNRARIAAAARGVFARDGPAASMASVAREAGVGIATMFRRFPTKEELVAAVFADHMDTYTDASPPVRTPRTPGTASSATSRPRARRTSAADRTGPYRCGLGRRRCARAGGHQVTGSS
ncbi:TetR/AcrR family transcriptional regulator [Streptomyces sp. NPDC001536]|uniref:TetR/AcrR family transcriptional regulator n=1 Tax=Streptomyces sp. NPDC001536 TaxID=3364583 RepID=UPI003693F5CF